MSFQTVTLYVVLVVSLAAMLVGVAVMAGWLVSREIPRQFSTILGAVVFLYGAYRFVIAFFRNAHSDRNETR